MDSGVFVPSSDDEIIANLHLPMLIIYVYIYIDRSYLGRCESCKETVVY